jgi:hypothetical protein
MNYATCAAGKIASRITPRNSVRASCKADELRRQADQFVDIVELQPKISRDPSERAARETRELRHVLQRGTTQQRASDDEDEFEG